MPQNVHIVFLIYAAFLGASVGSFMNVCIGRLPEGQSLVRPRSHCPRCGGRIAWYDNIPLLSWLLLRGKCRQCRQPISIQYPAVELLVALLWLGMALAFGPTWRALQGSILFSLLLTISVIDARHYLIPDALSLGGLGAGLALALLPGPPSILTSLMGAALGFGVLLAVGVAGEWVFKKPAMGGGDIKMMAMVGAFLGPAGAMLTIFLGALAGTIVFAPISLKTKKEVPFGVFLSLGAAIAFLFGEMLVDWYSNTVFGA
ncbi:MAG: prepilin peptidase [marine benthic group bacterium]|jgi:leader peptidase (prepilin peptidase)/N-methyltransferase|nr:prepilin peptidase [Candidatus Benthicola marisminoris]